MKIQKLQARLCDQEDTFLLEKTHSVDHMRRETLEDAKNRNIDNCIAEALDLEITAFEINPTRPTA